MTVLLKYEGGVHVFDDVITATDKQREIGGELFFPLKTQSVDIVFDGPPSHESGRFVEVEDSTGRSIKCGEWIDRKDGHWALRIPVTRILLGPPNPPKGKHPTEFA